MHYLVSWSGGVDSTALIFRLLSEKHKVTAVYTHIANNSLKSKFEAEAILSIKRHLPKDGTFELREDISTFGIERGSSLISLLQPILWLTSLFYSMSKEHEAVAIGYVMGDCAVSYQNEIRLIWKSFFGLAEGQSIVPLEFPITKCNKTELWKSLPEPVQRLVHWCEKPTDCDTARQADNLPHGLCDPCKKMHGHGLLDRCDPIKA